MKENCMLSHILDEILSGFQPGTFMENTRFLLTHPAGIWKKFTHVVFII